MSETTQAPAVGVIKATVQPTAQTVQAPVSIAGRTTVAAPSIPKGIQKFNTSELLNSGYMHAVIYAETSARKSTTAARFGTPENTRIILTRRKEQLIPLADLGYEAIVVNDAQGLLYALQYPEKLWPEWAGRTDRVLILDDVTEAVAMLLEENKEIDGREVRDVRRSYRATADDLRSAVQSVLNKPMHFIIIALAKVKSNVITGEDTVGPDLPPSMMGMLMSDFEFVFYIKPSTWKFLTDRDMFTTQKVNSETGKTESYTKKIFSKHKLPLSLIGKGIIKKEEEMDLRKLWEKRQAAVKSAPATPVTGGTK